MFWVKDLLDPAPLEMRMVAKHVHKVSPGDAKQYRRAVHVNGDDVPGPSRERYHPTPPFPNHPPIATIPNTIARIISLDHVTGGRRKVI